MLKYGQFLLAFTLLFLCKISIAQKADSVKIDTALLNRYRVDPPKNILPVRTKPITLHPEPIPVVPLGYEVSYWRKYFSLGINLNQSAFSDNWSGGGVSSFALGTNFDFKAEYNQKPLSYTTELIMIYGISKNKGQISRKTNDRIFLDNKLATQLSKKWYFFGSLSFESQFAQGFQYGTDKSGNVTASLISSFMSPGYFTESVGFEYKPVKYIDIRFGTGTARQTLVLDTTIYHNISGNYGVNPRSIFRNELAFQVVSTINKDIAQNMNLQARYALFIPYNNNFSYITHRVDATLTARVNRLINVTITGTMLYDITTNQSIQASQGLALGMVYKFP